MTAVSMIAKEMEGIPSTIGAFRVRTANETIEEARQREDPAPLWREFWYSGELCFLFADTNLGKSILAVQIAEEIAQRQRVLYIDFEMSDKQFQLRYTDVDGSLHKFPDNLLRVDIDPDNDDDEDEEQGSDSKDIARIVSNIEELATTTESKIVIVDNISFLCNAFEKGDVAGLLVKKLHRLKRKHGLSMLVLGHTPKQAQSSGHTLTKDSLAGSKRLMNFCDSAFAIGQNTMNTEGRYIKQIKCRFGSFTYGENNVLECHIEKAGDMTRFVFTGTTTESMMTASPVAVGGAGGDGTKEAVAALLADPTKPHSVRKVAKELGITQYQANKYINQTKESAEAEADDLPFMPYKDNDDEDEE